MTITADQIEKTVNTWFSDKMRGEPLSRHTEAYNQVFQARTDLISRLQALLPAEPVATEEEETTTSTTKASPQE